MLQTEQLSETLTAEEIAAYDEQAAKLSATPQKPYTGKKVLPVVFINPETKERIQAFVYVPGYQIQIAIADKSLQTGAMSAGDELRELITIKEASHILTYGETRIATGIK